MASYTQDTVLLSSYLQTLQQERTNQILTQLQQTLTSPNPDYASITKDIQLSHAQLKKKQIDDLKTRWKNIKIPIHSKASIVKLHTQYINEINEEENKRLSNLAVYISNKKAASRTPNQINADSLGVSTSRRPMPKPISPTLQETSGAYYGTDPQTGAKRPDPLQWPDQITDIKLFKDSLVYLPASKNVDLRQTISTVLNRGEELGFCKVHYASVFKLLISEHFPNFAGHFDTNTDPEASFANVLIVCQSLQIANKLQQTLLDFKRTSGQSLPEFSSVLMNLASRTAAETFLQMTKKECQEFVDNHLLTYITYFVSRDTALIFNSQKQTSLRSNPEFNTFLGASQTLDKIESYLKPIPQSYAMPSELYKALTQDSSRDAGIMLQSLRLDRKANHENRDASKQYRNNSGTRTFPHHSRPNSPRFDRSKSPRYNSSHDGSSYRGNNSKNPNSAQNHSSSNGRHSGNDQAHQFPTRRNSGRDRSYSAQTDNGHNDKNKSSSPFRKSNNDYSRAENKTSYNSKYSPSQQRHHNDGNRNNDRNRSRSSESRAVVTNDSNPIQPYRRPRSNSGHAESYRRDRPASRSLSRGRRPICPYCGGQDCKLGECTNYEMHQRSMYPCAECKFLHRTKFHIVKQN